MSIIVNGIELTEVIYAGVNLDTVKVKKGTAEAVTVFEKAVVMPNKGDIITLDSKQYRVLKTEGTVAEVLCMYDAKSSIKFDGTSGYNNTYAGRNIDTYCNNAFYSGLPAAMKNAIVDKTFTQDSWKRQWKPVPTGPHYTGNYESSPYYLTLANAAYGSSIARHCYCLSVQDVLDYLEATTSMGISDTTLTKPNILKMFWNVTTSPSSKYILLRSASSSSSRNVSAVNNSGVLDITDVNNAEVARPAFQIDLSKIAWSK